MISIIIPLYNEEGSLDELYRSLRDVSASLSDELEIVFVNDGSTDRSARIIDEIAESDHRVVAVHLRRNFGQTSALMAGFDRARGEIFVCLDADLQNDPRDIPSLIAKLEEGYDVVSGWRKRRKDSLFSRVLISRVANGVISLISGVRIHDSGCSLKVYRARLIEGVRLYGEIHRFIPIYAAWQGARITEQEVRHHPRKHGNSHYGLERIFKVIMDLIVVKFLHKYQQKPMYVFGAAGTCSFAISFFAGVLALYYKFGLGYSFILTPLPLLCAMTFITGMMCILMGLLAEIVIRTYYEAQEKKTYIVERVTGSREVAGSRE